MTETIRYGLIGLEDLAIGTGTYEVVLADGRVAVLTQIDLARILTGLTAGSVPYVSSAGYLTEDATNLTWDATNAILSVKSIKLLASGTLRKVDTNGTLIHAWGTAT